MNTLRTLVGITILFATSIAYSAVTLTVMPLSGGSGYTITAVGEINVDSFTFLFDEESSRRGLIEEVDFDYIGAAGHSAYARISGSNQFFEAYRAVNSSFTSVNVPEIVGTFTEYSIGFYVRQEDGIVAFYSDFFEDNDTPPIGTSIPVNFVWTSATGSISDWDGAVFEWDSNGESAGGEKISLRVITEPYLDLQQIGPEIEIEYLGTIQETNDLTDPESWTDISPQPASPWRFTPTEAHMFFRAKL